MHDWIEIGGIWRKELQPRAGRLDGLARASNLVGGEIVHDHDLAGRSPVRACHADVFAVLFSCAQAFLRNGYRLHWLDDKAQGLSARRCTIAGLVGGCTRVDVVHPMTQGVVEENCELARGRGDRLDARGEPPVEGPPG